VCSALKQKSITRAERNWDAAALEDNCYGARCAIQVITTHRNLQKSLRVEIWDEDGTGYYGVLAESKSKGF
jgi:hypothetical protein